LQKSLQVCHRKYFLKFPSFLKNFKTTIAQPTQMTAKAKTVKDYNNSTDKTPAGNSTYKKLAVQWLNEALCFVSSSVVVSS
jgi:hypothetical protein